MSAHQFLYTFNINFNMNVFTIIFTIISSLNFSKWPFNFLVHNNYFKKKQGIDKYCRLIVTFFLNTLYLFEEIVSNIDKNIFSCLNFKVNDFDFGWVPIFKKKF